MDDTVTLYTQQTQPKEGESRKFTSLALVRGEEWLFILSEQREVPDIPELPLQVFGDGDIAFRESGRMQGLCEAVRIEHQLQFEWKGRRYRIDPGQTLQIEGTDEGKGVSVTLVQNSEINNAQCRIDPILRSSIYVIAN